MKGYNGTIFAYGQSSSGKTFSMLGPDAVVQHIVEGAESVPKEVQKMYGIIPRAIVDIFAAINKEMSEGAEIALSMNYFEIYNEKLMDLLAVSDKGS
jgi:hypothetical protein